MRAPCRAGIRNARARLGNRRQVEEVLGDSRRNTRLRDIGEQEIAGRHIRLGAGGPAIRGLVKGSAQLESREHEAPPEDVGNINDKHSAKYRVRMNSAGLDTVAGATNSGTRSSATNAHQ